MQKFILCLVCSLGLGASSSVLPPGLSEPLTKMAERMARISQGSSVTGFLQRSKNDALNVHIAEPTKINKWSAEQIREFESLAKNVINVQGEEFQALDTQEQGPVKFNLFAPVEDASVLKERLTQYLSQEQKKSEEKSQQFWSALHKKSSFLQNEITDIADRWSKTKGSKAALLEKLITLVGTPGAADAMRFGGALSKAAAVMASESASEAEKARAGSLITLLTDTPVSGETSKVDTGSDGHVTIVLPSPQRIYGRATPMSSP